MIRGASVYRGDEGYIRAIEQAASTSLNPVLFLLHARICTCAVSRMGGIFLRLNKTKTNYIDSLEKRCHDVLLNYLAVMYKGVAIYIVYKQLH